MNGVLCLWKLEYVSICSCLASNLPGELHGEPYTLAACGGTGWLELGCDGDTSYFLYLLSYEPCEYITYVEKNKCKIK